MTSAKHEFEEITLKFIQNAHVTRSEFQSSPAIAYKNEVFAMLRGKNLVLKLGKGFDGIPYGLVSWYYPNYGDSPSTDWVLIRYFYLEEEWKTLVMLTLQMVQRN